MTGETPGTIISIERHGCFVGLTCVITHIAQLQVSTTCYPSTRIILILNSCLACGTESDFMCILSPSSSQRSHDSVLYCFSNSCCHLLNVVFVTRHFLPPLPCSAFLSYQTTKCTDNSCICLDICLMTDYYNCLWVCCLL